MAELIGDAGIRIAPLTDVDAWNRSLGGKTARSSAATEGSRPPTRTP